MINKDGINRLIDILKAVDDSENSVLGFDMNTNYKYRLSSNHSCGSACCIGGWCQKMLIDAGDKTARAILLGHAFMEITGSDMQTASQVCFPDYSPAYHASLPAAIHMLQELRDGAEVDWETAVDMYGKSEHTYE